MPTDLQRFTEACNYPGLLDEPRVDRELGNYLNALGVQRQIVRLKPGWRVEEHPSLLRTVNEVLDDAVRLSPGLLAARAALDAQAAQAALDARDARDALDARDARDARAARDAQDARLQSWAAWCVQSGGWWWYGWEMSWIVTTHFGAQQLGKAEVDRWAAPLFESYIAGAWLLYWTDDTLYWAAKPVVHVERTTQGDRRLHNDKGAALESDVENLYYWHGVMVPAFVILRPDWITAEHITTENNAEIRRVMLECFGVDRYMAEIGGKVLHEDTDGLGHRRRLLHAEMPGDEPLVMIEVVNSTQEPDGSWKNYTLRVDPQAYGGRAGRECLAAIASTWRRGPNNDMLFARPEDYRPAVEA